ncbi:unnamed protein product [Mytilus edulis]|uniref:Uncharacterized protein n=1 Tax=Mytilus edulis TaxID=6550 RepID=A0A8S3S623_MYTED|nr:unnamed protein product [Mytilus edulis]
MKCCQIKILYDFAIRRKWYGVLQLVLNCDHDRSIDKIRIIDDLFQLGYIKEQYIYEDEYEEDEYEEYYYDYAPFKKYVQFIRKHYLNEIDVDKIIEKACTDGVHTVVEGLILNNVDDISYYLDFTLNNLRFQQLKHSVSVFKRDYGKILLLFLKRVNNTSIDLNSVMNDVCHIGFSSVVLWLLQK